MNRTPEELAALAAKLGSDIPFFFYGPSSICTGLGEIVRPIPPPRARRALLIFPPFGMPTPKVYRRFDEMKLGERRNIEEEPDFSAWAKLSAIELLPNLVNDLEAPAFDQNPAMADLRVRWERRLGRVVRMSGSGSTLFTLYDNQAEAASAGGFSGDLSCVVEISPAAPGLSRDSILANATF
jgi:4-diphosphocytidyl-2C-methyl-D-erythritol kinase